MMQVKYSPKIGQIMKCIRCGKPVKKTGTRQFYCLKCKLWNVRRLATNESNRQQAVKKNLKKNPVYPRFYCECGNRIQLDFEPNGTVKEKRKWLHFRCPECGHKIRN